MRENERERGRIRENERERDRWREIMLPELAIFKIVKPLKSNMTRVPTPSLRASYPNPAHCYWTQPVDYSADSTRSSLCLLESIVHSCPYSVDSQLLGTIN